MPEMFLMLVEIARIILNVVWWVIIVQAVLSWLLAFNVMSLSNPTMAAIWETLDRMTEPLYRPIRKIMPDFGALDLSPMVVLVLLAILQGPVLTTLAQMALGGV